MVCEYLWVLRLKFVTSQDKQCNPLDKPAFMSMLLINCDLGEGIGPDSDLLPHIDLCSLACGGHAGDREILKEVMELAMHHGVLAGAHPSYPDLRNFGRVSMQLPPEVLKESLLEQIGLFQYVGTSMGIPMHHIKAHGALYNDVASDPVMANIYLEIVEPFKETAYLMVPPKSEIARKAQVMGFSVLYEAFADRAYTPNGQLLPRGKEGAVITSPELVWMQYNSLSEKGVVFVSNEPVSVVAQTACIHGDNPNAIAIVEHLSNQRKQWTSSS